jgi:class 3 adenylate cyclase
MFNDAGHFAFVVDSQFQIVFVTDEWIRSLPRMADLEGQYMFGFGALEIIHSGELTDDPYEAKRESFRANFTNVLARTPGGRAELREKVDPDIADLVDELPDQPVLEARSDQRLQNTAWGISSAGWSSVLTIRDDTGRPCGHAFIQKPAAGMSSIWMAAGGGDTRHPERTHSVSRPARRPAAILFADLEGSSSLSRRLSTAEYFALGRRLVRAADESVVLAGGVVGRHLGDGVTAFFLAESLGSESAAARACIEASRALRDTVAGIAARSHLDPAELILRFGLHWGSTLYVGLFKSIARAEVTALGDEVNETARIEACATGGRTLASKDLIERLSRPDSEALGIERVSYVALGELPSATEKARRDAPSISVCVI